ncbi:hypothetical protein [Desulfotruncus alcoholivorax]|uniref:hypothetical protein n=1 Tax=Desulfotruncus alcoholivorax TaxID=265477 RepID=UPI0003F95C32|nr:hypothetical protein [Desulfotruncus alcoholivorax]
MHKMGKPNSLITWEVRTDGFKFRQADLTGEARHHHAVKVGKLKQEERKEEDTWCRVADDDPIVVLNP